MPSTRQRSVVSLVLLAFGVLGAPAALQAQQCLGVPAGLTVLGTILSNRDGASRTVSAGAAASVWKDRIVAVGEYGQITSGAELLPDKGEYASAGLGFSHSGKSRLHPCVMGGATWGKGPSASNVVAPSLDGSYALVGSSFELYRTAKGRSLQLFGSWQMSLVQDDTGSVARGGVMYSSPHHWFIRGTYDVATGGGASRDAISGSFGLRLR